MACVFHRFAMLHGVIVKLLFWVLPWQHVVWRQQAGALMVCCLVVVQPVTHEGIGL